MVVHDVSLDQCDQESQISGSESENDIMIDMKPPKINLNPLYMAIVRDVLSRFASSLCLVVMPLGVSIITGQKFRILSETMASLPT